VEAFLKQLILWLIALPLLAQSNVGELRLKVAGQDGLALKASVELSSDATQFHRFFDTDDSGLLSARTLPFGLYRLRVEREADVQNLNNRLNVIDFAGLFSGYAVAPPRNYALRLTTTF